MTMTKNILSSVAYGCPVMGSSTALMSGQDGSMPPPCLAGMKIYNEAKKEYDQILKAHPVLAPTGCTPQFCQSGRMTKLNEPRVGRDRDIAEIRQEAVGFLRECRDQGIIHSDAELEQRIQTALTQIKDSAVESTLVDGDGQKFRGLAGGTWDQTFEELEYGLRASWRNSRRCIMRSKFEQLILCDLRHVTTSRGMAETIIEGLQKAFNGGHILPTAFVFPPRQPGKRGPMIWNSNIFGFAGYRQEDGSVLGDPINAELTQAMIDLGWQPPAKRSRWDVLPLVTMAEGQQPFLAELPVDLKRTIRITHPRYRKEFKDLDLQWLLAPALSRLGFDIGGTQYTASPFLGWFLDSEIGVRNLADSFRYNVLPDVVKRLKLSDDLDTPFEDLPEFMKLAALSRAQAELNYAVQHTYNREHVTMVDSLTGSADYLKFDQERKEEVGYRLPADVLWLAPPQGSIVPVWHEGAAPNYQPKPMICKHVQDPVKAWKRENPDWMQKHKEVPITKVILAPKAKLTIKIFSCSAGINAGKMARKLHDALARLAQETNESFFVVPEKPLNTLKLEETEPLDVILIVASTTGQGEIPRNGMKFMKAAKLLKQCSAEPQFSIYGNGDTTYGDTYNTAGIEIHKLMEEVGCRPFLANTFTGDTAVNNPDWTSFNKWVDAIKCALQGQGYIESTPEPNSDIVETKQLEKLPVMSTGELVEVNRLSPGGLLRVTLDIGDLEYSEMDHIKIMPPNCDHEVNQALSAFGLKHYQKVEWHHEKAYDYLSRYVDLSQPFKSMDWYPGFQDLNPKIQKSLQSLRAVDILATLRQTPPTETIKSACQNLATIRPRLFSVASSPAHSQSAAMSKKHVGNLVDVIVKMNHGGRFSDFFLGDAHMGAKIRFSISRPDSWKVIESQPADAPFLAITTGSGIGPVRAILQRRIPVVASTVPAIDYFDSEASTPASSGATSRQLSRSSSISSFTGSPLINSGHFSGTTRRAPGYPVQGPVSLFAGFKAEDLALINDIVHPASQAGLFDMLELVPSNSRKVRVQDRLLQPEVKSKLTKLLSHPSAVVFVCGNESAADATAINLSQIVGTDIKDMLQDRYVEEVFRC